MNEVTLQLKHASGPIREPVAWFIAGGNVPHWLEELCRWRIPQETLRLLVLPKGLENRSVAGVLVIPPAGARPACIPRALAFGIVAGKLYLPVDAELWPPVEAHELKLLHEAQVFHPAIGLVGFEPAEFLKVADLLRQPPSRVENWNFARPGIQINQRLRSVQLVEPVTFEEMFGDAPKEIGSEPLEQLPAAPNEPGKNSASELWNEANRRFAQVLHKLLGLVPHTAIQRTWINDLDDWAARRFQKLTAELEKLRNKEINRLLHQLENDPDQGLRHAIPLSQLGHRGQAPPSARLGERRLDFNLGNLRGGKAGDIWHLDAQIQAQLLAKYRELANRELQLGRFRRAAYIFAELLGDLEAAASALKQGSHFREAAALYKDHLRRPREAAVCLAEGGLFAEAIAIYEHESLFLEAGDLYAKLGQADQAKAAYQLEVERRLKQGDRLGSAQLLEQKIDEPEAALKVLNEGWPSSAQAGQCLAAEFELLARKSWHAKTVERLESLRVEATSANMVSTLARVLANQSAQYPDRVIRHSAADIVRVKASERLETAASAAELSALTDTLNTLAPEDKLLARDSSRFTSNAKERFRRNKRLPARLGKAGHPILVRTFQLPKGVRWHTVKSCGGFYFAAGNGSNPQSGEKALVLIRGDWEGMQQPLGFPPPILMPPPLLLELDEETSRPGRLIMTSGPSRPLIRIGERAFPAADRFPGLVPAGTPDWLPNDVVKVCTRGARAWVLRDWGGGIVECRTIAGDILSSFTVSEAFAGNPGTIFSSSLLVQRDFLWLAGKQRLLLYRQGQIVAQWEAETEIQSLVASAPNLPVCVAVRLAKGVSLHWVDALKERTETLCAELLQPLAAFTANGTLVLMRGNEGRICEVSPRATKGISSFELLGQTPIEVVRADGPNRFGVFSADGKVQLFRVDE